MKLTIWRTLPTWDTSYYMEAQPAHILVPLVILVVALTTTGIQEKLIYHLKIHMLWLKNGLIL